MSIAGVRSSRRMARRTTNGKTMKLCAHPTRVTAIACSFCLLVTGCSAKPRMSTGTPESQAQAGQLVRDRELELTTLRGEMAATRIAAAKKEAELQELRDLVQQLRQENAEARQMVLEMREQAEQRRGELERVREEQERHAQAQTTQHLTLLKDTMMTLAHEVGQLRQDLTKPVLKEQGKASKGTGRKSAEPGKLDGLLGMPQRVPSGLGTPATSATAPGEFTRANAVSGQSQATSITVQPGDTLWRLAKQHRTSVAALRERNQLDGEALAVGQVLLLPHPLLQHP